jgi:hypothetical protein
MASIEQRGRSFRVVFRYHGRRFTRSLRTADERQAAATLARLEDNLRRVELGTLSVPEGSDVATFLLSDGRQSAKRERSEIRTLSHLLSSYFENIPPDSLEQCRAALEKRHVRGASNSTRNRLWVSLTYDYIKGSDLSRVNLVGYLASSR